MSEPTHPNDWRQFAEDVAACACHAASVLVPDHEQLKAVRKEVLQLEARLLRGLLGFVEGRLREISPSPRAASEKIKIE
jgi:hypothetical protein